MTTAAATAKDPYVNVLDPAFYVDPWDAYRWLRDEAPCFWDPVQQLWVITRYDDVMAIEKDGGRYSSFSGSRPQIDQSADRSMINMDDPTHQEQRKLVARRFNPGGVRGQEDHVRDLVTEILDPVVPLGECEVVEAIASRLPAMMIGDLLGYPSDMWELLRHWSEQTMTLGGLNMTDGPPYVSHPDVVPVMVDFFTQTGELVEARRVEPRDDLISIWVAQGWETMHVLEETLLLLDGGAETTRTVIGSMIRELALQPDQRRLLVERPELLSTTAIEEFIRWVTPILNMRRTVTEEHELHGQTLREGDQVVLMYAAANRDPRAFTDPDRLDVTRPDNRHVSFGFGTHFCLGAWLARLELRVMFEELLRRIPDWELVDPDEPQVVSGTFARAYDQIRIRYPS
jgi:cytochrome P450 family 142 subfamily A polypeptide 1